MEKYYVYAYLDPTRPGKFEITEHCTLLYRPIYIGKGRLDRINVHMVKIKNGTYQNHPFYNYLNVLHEEGLSPFIVKIFEDCEEDLAYELECKSIACFGIKSNNGLLYNLTLGGEVPVRISREQVLSGKHVSKQYSSYIVCDSLGTLHYLPKGHRLYFSETVGISAKSITQSSNHFRKHKEIRKLYYDDKFKGWFAVNVTDVDELFNGKDNQQLRLAFCDYLRSFGLDFDKELSKPAVHYAQTSKARKISEDVHRDHWTFDNPMHNESSKLQMRKTRAETSSKRQGFKSDEAAFFRINDLRLSGFTVSKISEYLNISPNYVRARYVGDSMFNSIYDDMLIKFIDYRKHLSTQE